MFNKLKNWRRVAICYDKTANSFLAFLTIASIKQSLSFVHDAYIFVRFHAFTLA
jgi:hypothetical protein